MAQRNLVLMLMSDYELQARARHIETGMRLARECGKQMSVVDQYAVDLAEVISELELRASGEDDSAPF